MLLNHYSKSVVHKNYINERLRQFGQLSYNEMIWYKKTHLDMAILFLTLGKGISQHYQGDTICESIIHCYKK